MRSNIKYLLITLMVFVQFSCTDWMELLPPGELIREEFWESKEDVESVLMAAYEQFISMDDDLFLQGELRGDMLMDRGDISDDQRKIMTNNIYPDNNLCNWQDYYKIINNSNEVIINAPLVQKIDNTFNDFQMKSLQAEAYFLRSLTYFYLVRIYRDVPLVLEPSETDNAKFYVPQSSEDEVLDQVVSDLMKNREFAPSGGFATIAENKGRASKAAFDALLADIALWRFQYEEVLTHVSKIESNERFDLMPGSKWFEIFYPGNSLESIFEFQYDEQFNQKNSLYSLTSRFGNKYAPSRTAIELFSVDFVRGDGATINEFSEDNYLIWKYVGQMPDGQTGRAGSEQSSANWIIYRLSDILLMKAEALSQLGRYNEALTVINQIRERANVPSLAVAETPDAFEDVILEERAREFAYEGKRWFDLLRMGRRNEFKRKRELIEIIIRNVPSTQKRVLATKLTDPLGWYLPVYDNEIERNRNLEQNPYYTF